MVQLRILVSHKICGSGRKEVLPENQSQWRAYKTKHYSQFSHWWDGHRTQVIISIGSVDNYSAARVQGASYTPGCLRDQKKGPERQEGNTIDQQLPIVFKVLSACTSHYLGRKILCVERTITHEGPTTLVPWHKWTAFSQRHRALMGTDPGFSLEQCLHVLLAGQYMGAYHCIARSSAAYMPQTGIRSHTEAHTKSPQNTLTLAPTVRRLLRGCRLLLRRST